MRLFIQNGTRGKIEKSSPLILSRFEIFAGVLVSFGSFLVSFGSFSPVRAPGLAVVQTNL